MSALERLQRLLGGAELARLRKSMRGRYEANPSPETLQLTGLTQVERKALAELVGRAPSDAKSMLLDVGTLDEVLSTAGIASSLRNALEMLDGPIVDPRAERALLYSVWMQVVSDCSAPTLQAWLTSSTNLGLLKRLSRNDATRASLLLRRASSVLRRLPCGGIPRAQLAAEVLGDAHGLDTGQPTATIVLSALRSSRLSEDSDEESEDAGDRSLWADAGVLVNELARPALCLNVPVLAESCLAPTLGRPIFFSLRDLVRSPPAWGVSGMTVFVCENPNIVAMAADRLGARCAPLVCTDGMPAAAQRVLLEQLVAAGASLAYHGDFDWAGMRIASHVFRTLAAKPWRMEAEDYRSATQQTAEKAPLSEQLLISFWNEDLAHAMAVLGVAIAEEAVFDTLVADLTLPD